MKRKYKLLAAASAISVVWHVVAASGQKVERD
jgi:hypothetical protein